MFIQDISPIKVKEGNPGELVCTVVGNPFPVVQWFQNEKLVKNSENFILTTDSKTGNCKLSIRSLNLNDEGFFLCKIINPFGAAQSKAYLSVISKYYMNCKILTLLNID